MSSSSSRLLPLEPGGEFARRSRWWREPRKLDVHGGDRPVELERWRVVVTHGEAGVAADEQSPTADLPAERQVAGQRTGWDRVAIDRDRYCAAVGPVADPQLVRPR